jgi:hypothetical protein
MFGERFRWKDEIYQYDLRYKPENLRVLVSVDMAASSPKEPWHVPVSWVRDYGKGRVFSTNFGHNEATWKDPTFQKHATEGIAWALGKFAAPTEPNPEVQAAEYLRSVVAAAAAATGGDHDALRARADAKIAADPAWAEGLRPELLELRGMTPEARKAAMTSAIGSWAHSSPAEAATFAAQIPAGPEQVRAVTAVLNDFVRIDPSRAAEWITRFPEGELRSQANNILLNQWTRENPAAAAEWLNLMPESPSRQQAIQTFVSQASNQEPEAAWNWAGAVTEDSTRASLLESAAAQWMRLDPAKAAVAIQASKLPPEVIERLLKSPE